VLLPPDDARSRLLQATVDTVVDDGYVQATIGDIAQRADVSRASFYEYFANKEDCFLAAYRRHAELVTEGLASAVEQGDPQMGAHAMVGELARWANDEPRAFTYLTHRGMVAGPSGWEARDRLMQRLAELIEEAWSETSDEAQIPDLPARLLLESAVRLLGVMLRREQRISEKVRADLLSWIDLYRTPAARTRWRGGRWRGRVSPTAATHTSARGGRLPPLAGPLPNGRRRARSEAERALQRESIIYATAETIRERGVAELTVADIASSCGLSRDVFYRHFRDKDAAFEETINFVFERLMASVTGGFFQSRGDWCARLWSGWGAVVDFLETNATFAYLIFIAANAPVPLVNRVDDLVRAFTIFLDGGYRHRAEAERVPRLVPDVLVGAALEAASFHVRHDRIEELRERTPIVVYTLLAPFLGADDATRYVEQRSRQAISGRALLAVGDPA
jgi:AcrR family transcriptional regulator